jgi:hypothetical protein
LKEVADACYQNSMRLYGWSSEDWKLLRIHYP